MDTRIDRRDGAALAARWAFACSIGASVLGGGALGCNTVLSIESAALEPALSDAGAGAPSGEPGALVDSSGEGPAAEQSASAPDGDGVSDTSGATTERPTPSSPANPVAPDPGKGSGTSTPTTPMPAADAGASAPAPDTEEPSVPTQPQEPPLDASGLAVALPNDLRDAPVSGEIVYSEEASWEVDGVFRPTFEVHTPTASYWIVESLGTMVSMQDAYSGRLQWIDFSSGFRPLRNIPALSTPPASVRTLLDRDSQTPTHLRLTSESADGAWRWVWDIYITHATLTIDRAPVPIGFSYRGVPGGALGVEDQLVQSDGTAQGARNSFNGDVPGPVEWVYLADTAARRSLFLMQHRDDSLPEAYQVRDNDSAAFSFGGGAITALPLRFSLGLVDSTDYAVVSQRVAYVASAIH